MDWSIQEVARLAGTTSRTLRHYQHVGVLQPSRVGDNGYRYYDAAALRRLQRILMLRELGLSLDAIADVLGGDTDDAAALRMHLTWLTDEKQRLQRQIDAVAATIRGIEEGEDLMAEDMLDGFDNTQHRDEVEQRWGKDSYAQGNRWWRGLGSAGQREFKEAGQRLAADYSRAREAGMEPTDERVREIAARHAQWVATSWGGKTPTAEQFAGLGQMYVSDERFASYYGGPQAAAFVSDAMAAYARESL